MLIADGPAIAIACQVCGRSDQVVTQRMTEADGAFFEAQCACGESVAGTGLTPNAALLEYNALQRLDPDCVTYHGKVRKP